MKGKFYHSEKKCRVSLWIPVLLNARLDSDAKLYGITKTSIITTAIVQYYKNLDMSCRESGN